MNPQDFVALLVAAVLSLVVAVTAYVSTQPWTAAGNGNSEAPHLSDDGGFVSFESAVAARMISTLPTSGMMISSSSWAWRG